MKLLILSIGFVILLWPAEIRGCACCLPRGTWGVATNQYPRGEQFREHFLTILQGFRLRGELQSNEIGKGPEVLMQVYSVTGKHSEGAWLFSVVAPDSTEIPLMRLNHPEEYEEFFSDNATGSQGAAITHAYKEWRFFCTVEPLSAQVPLVAGSKATLVLQGRGNGCANPSDFERWLVNLRVGTNEVEEGAVAVGVVK